jgi:uncharacterized membrane protein YbhN (UPF0104 family)
VSAPIPNETGRRGKRRPFITYCVSLAVSLFLVWLLMRGLSWQRLFQSVLSSSSWRLALYALIGLLGLWLRAVRFRMILPEPRPSRVPVFAVTLVQNALGDLIPARLASLGSYVWLLSRRFSVTSESAAATFIVAFVLDLLSLGPLLLLAAAVRLRSAALSGAAPFSLWWLVAFAMLFFAVSAAATWWLAPLVKAAGRWLRCLGRGRSDGLWMRGAAYLERVAAAMAVVRGRGMLLRLLAVSLAIRVVKYAALFALTEALLVGAGTALPRPNPWDLIIGVSATELIATLPIPAFGQFGVWEGGMVGALLLMGFSREPATLVAFGVHGITTAYEYLLALLALAGLFWLGRRRSTAP